MRSFIEVFPEGHLFAVWRSSDVILVAAPPGRRLALDRLRDPRVGRLLARAHISSPELLAAYYAAPLSALAPIAAGAALNSDDRPVVEYWAPRDLVAVGRSVSVLDPEIRARIPRREAMPEGALFADWSKERWLEVRAPAPASPFARGSQLLAEGNAPEARDAFERAVALESVERARLAVPRRLPPGARGCIRAEAALSHVKPSAEPQVQAQAAAVAGAIEALRQHAREALAGRSQPP